MNTTSRIATLLLAAALAMGANQAFAADATATTTPGAAVDAADTATPASDADTVGSLKQIYRCRAKGTQLQEAAPDCRKLIGFVSTITGVRS